MADAGMVPLYQKETTVTTQRSSSATFRFVLVAGSVTTVDQISAFDLLTWAHLHDGKPVDWVAGALLFGGALLGAALTLYSTSPTELPSLGGTDEVRDLSDDLRALERLQTSSLSGTRKADNMLDERRQFLTHLSARVLSARRALWLRGIPLFLVIGPAIACLVATTVWQAVLIGVTGPSIWKSLEASSRTKSLAADAGQAITDLTQTAQQDQQRISALEGQLDRTRSLLDTALGALDAMRGGPRASSA